MSKFMVGDRVVRKHESDSPANSGEVIAIHQGKRDTTKVRWPSGEEMLYAEYYLDYAPGSLPAEALKLVCPRCRQEAHHACVSTVWSPGVDEAPVHEERLQAAHALRELVAATNRALPKAPYTTIVVQWRDPELQAARMFTLSGGGGWASADGAVFEDLDIIGFEIKGQPVAVGYEHGWKDATAAKTGELLDKARREGAAAALARFEEINRMGVSRVPQSLAAVREEFEI
jgi:hypothetical protein